MMLICIEFKLVLDITVSVYIETHFLEVCIIYRLKY